VRLTPAVLVITDISGYTSFIKHRAVSLVHAEAIVTDLLEAVIDRAAHPLTVNKLEGDAALLYAETGADPAPAIRDAVAQVAAFFDAFAARLGLVRDQRRHCTCEACTSVTGLALKAFVHHGEIAIKQVRQFEELAGEEVILIHRLLKNHVPSREYVLMTEPVKRAIGDAVPECSPLREEIEGLDPVTIWWAPSDAPSLRRLARSARTAPTAPAPSPTAPPETLREFTHLPRYPVNRIAEVRDRLGILAGTLFRRRAPKRS
jgi:hypothetical protein